MLEITTENLKKLMDSQIPLVIDFWAEWCAPCKAITPMMDNFAHEYQDRVKIGKCNVEENNDLTVQFKIQNVPTILFIRNGQVVDKQVGAVSRDIIASKIANLI